MTINTAYTGEVIKHSDGVDYAVIDTDKLDFSVPEAKFGKKTKPTIVRLAQADEEIVTVISGVEESRIKVAGGELIFINILPDGSEDAFVPRDAQGISNGQAILDERYELIGGDINQEGAIYKPKGPPVKILHEVIEKPSVIKDAWGEGKHAFFDKGATLKIENGRVSGIAKSAFDETWSITDEIGRIFNKRTGMSSTR